MQQQPSSSPAIALLFVPASYREYPAFAARRAQLQQDYHQEIEQVFEQSEAAFKALMAQGVSLSEVIEQCLHEPERRIEARYAHLIQQAIEQYQVPLLQKWNKAIEQTSAARYHDEHPRAGATRQVTIQQQEEGQVRIEFHEVVTLPREQVDSHLMWHECRAPSWEACVLAEPEEETATIASS